MLPATPKDETVPFLWPNKKLFSPEAFTTQQKTRKNIKFRVYAPTITKNRSKATQKHQTSTLKSTEPQHLWQVTFYTFSHQMLVLQAAHYQTQDQTIKNTDIFKNTNLAAGPTKLKPKKK